MIPEREYMGGKVGFWLRRFEKWAQYGDRTNSEKKQRKASVKAREAYLKAIP